VKFFNYLLKGRDIVSVLPTGFCNGSAVDVRTHFKPTETSIHEFLLFLEALRLLRTNSSQRTFEENRRNFAAHLKNRGYPAAIKEKKFSEFKFIKKNVASK